MRDTRMATYIAFSDACRGYALAAWDMLCEPSADLIAVMNDQQVAFQKALSRVVFVGPASVSVHAQQADQALDRLNDFACVQKEPYQGKSKNIATFAAFGDIAGAFEVEVAKHLGESNQANMVKRWFERPG
jgi:hypothetical protein